MDRVRFRTEIEQVSIGDRIDYAHRILTIGSCFAQNIGAELERAKFRMTINPTGVLFNPLSIASTLDRLHHNRPIEASELREGSEGRDGWYHLDFHSSLSGQTRDEALCNINQAIERGSREVADADWVVVSLGTAWIYERADGGGLVANCHRETARNFTRRRASHGEIVESLVSTIEWALSGKRVVLTLSPIRHVGDGLVENSLSKATLRVAIEEVVSRLSERVYYLPSYEILMDDLRDYRFYDTDMVHPSRVAVEYIWEYVQRTLLSERAQSLLPKVERIIRAREHRPTSPDSDAYRAFCATQLRAIEEISDVDFSEEEQYFRGFLR